MIGYRKDLKLLARQNRLNPSKAELKLWLEVLRKRNLGYRFLRQKPLLDYIVDFYCPRLKLVIEIDGDSHSMQVIYDLVRSKKLSNVGVTVIRYSNFEVLNNVEGVEIDIRNTINELNPPNLP